MKTYFMFIIYALVGFFPSWSQTSPPGTRTNPNPYPVEITYNKTMTIVFPTIIKSVDRGSKDILAQKTREVGNVLQLKAAREDFPETNLTVITADGYLHQFTVNYCKEPSELMININQDAGISRSARMIFSSDMTETDFQHYSEGILRSKRIIHFKHTGQYKVTFALLGIYIKENVIFYRLRVRNSSNINYDIDFLKFYVRDKAKIKRTASQEIEFKPLYICGDVATVKGKSEAEIVYALEKFTIPDSKYLGVEMFERKGGRHFHLSIKNKEIVAAHPLDK